MYKRPKRYVFCIERFEDGKPSTPLYIFVNRFRRDFVLCKVTKENRYEKWWDDLEIVVSENPEDFRVLQKRIYERIKETKGFKYTVGNVYPIKCDSSKCEYAVSTKKYSSYKTGETEIKTGKFKIKER